MNNIIAIAVAVILGILALKVVAGILKFVIVAAIVVGIFVFLTKGSR